MREVRGLADRIAYEQVISEVIWVKPNDTSVISTRFTVSPTIETLMMLEQGGVKH